MRPTRGRGLAEGVLSRWRAARARKELGAGASICDVGCGLVPHFAINTPYESKYLVDPVCNIHSLPSLFSLPGKVDNITMLAVLEHMTKDEGRVLLRTARLKMNNGGRLVITTPSAWTKPLLEWLARRGIVSQVEIDEHQCYYDKKTLKAALADFSAIRVSRFMFGANLVAVARK